jgi:hypothetical protein
MHGQPRSDGAAVKLSLQLDHWGATRSTDDAELVAAAEGAGFDTVFTAEACGSDAYTPLAWLGRQTTRMRLGTSVLQLSARTPTACAMAGDEGYVRRQLDRWAASGVTMILIRGNNAQHIRDLAHLATACGPELEKAGRQ